MSCTLELLLTLSKATYKQSCEFTEGVLKDVTDLPDGGLELQDIMGEVSKHRYHVIAARGPKQRGGTLFSDKPEQSPLGYVVAEPVDNDSTDPDPIVIAFRGTKLMGDILADADLTFTGTVGEKYREEAYNVYQEVRRRNPGREIVIVGHSLGGSLASYVTVKAMNTENERKITCRTFNSAEVSTTHQEILDTNPELAERFINYRLVNDPVSKIGRRIGSVFTLPSFASNPLTAHKLPTLIKDFPPELRTVAIGKVGIQGPLEQFTERVIAGMKDYEQYKVSQLVQFKSDEQKMRLMSVEMNFIPATMNRSDLTAEQKKTEVAKSLDQIEQWLYKINGGKLPVNNKSTKLLLQLRRFTKGNLKDFNSAVANAMTDYIDHKNSKLIKFKSDELKEALMFDKMSNILKILGSPDKTPEQKVQEIDKCLTQIEQGLRQANDGDLPEKNKSTQVFKDLKERTKYLKENLVANPEITKPSDEHSPHTNHTP